MPSWEDELIEELQQRSAAAASMTSPALEPLHLAFVALVQAARRSIQRIAEALGANVEGRGTESDGRIRWTYGARSLSIRFDSAAGKVFLSSDIGAILVQEELVMVDGELLDQRGRAISVGDVAERFVTVLFKGAVGV